jgi:hypothetical protein
MKHQSAEPEGHSGLIGLKVDYHFCMKPRPQTPAESVDVLAATIVVDDREERLAATRRLFLAATIFGGVCWLATLVTAVVSSETNGIMASWFAIFPSAFGLMGLVQVARGVSGRPALVAALTTGLAAMCLHFIFFATIWPAL